MNFDLHYKLEEESSLLHWYPVVSGELPVPHTTIFLLTDDERIELMKLLDGKPITKKLELRLHVAANVVGYPLFLRTDQASDKHMFRDAAYVESSHDLFGHIANTIEHNEMAGIMGLPWKALIFRQYIPLVHAFKAFNYLPIARERRYFVRDGKVICWHPYWIKDAIHGYGDCKLPDDWEHRLYRINLEDDDELKVLYTYAKRFSELIPGFWSVDFALAESGKWIFIDAARGELSWHPEDCPNCPEEVKTPKTEKPDFESMLVLKKKE